MSRCIGTDEGERLIVSPRDGLPTRLYPGSCAGPYAREVDDGAEFFAAIESARMAARRLPTTRPENFEIFDLLHRLECKALDIYDSKCGAMP